MKLYRQLLLPAISIFLGFTFFGAGMGKLFAAHQYIGWIGPVWLIERLEEYQLGFYAKFIAFSQVVIGYLLLTLRFRLVGGIMMIPLILNILMVTISQNWKGTPTVLGFLLLLNLLILLPYRHFLGPLLNEEITSTTPPKAIARSTQGHWVWLSGMALQLAAIGVSYHEIKLSFILSALGILLSFLSFRVDRGQSQVRSKPTLS